MLNLYSLFKKYCWKIRIPLQNGELFETGLGTIFQNGFYNLRFNSSSGTKYRDFFKQLY